MQNIVKTEPKPKPKPLPGEIVYLLNAINKLNEQIQPKPKKEGK